MLTLVMEHEYSNHAIASVPKLNVDGNNWLEFELKFEIYLEGAGLDEHLTPGKFPEDSYEKVEAKPAKKKDKSADDFKKHMDVWEEGEEKWKEKARAWKKEDAKAKSVLGKVVPTSIQQLQPSLCIYCTYKLGMKYIDSCWGLGMYFWVQTVFILGF